MHILTRLLVFAGMFASRTGLTCRARQRFALILHHVSTPALLHIPPSLLAERFYTTPAKSNTLPQLCAATTGLEAKQTAASSACLCCKTTTPYKTPEIQDCNCKAAADVLVIGCRSVLAAEHCIATKLFGGQTKSCDEWVQQHRRALQMFKCNSATYVHSHCFL